MSLNQGPSKGGTNEKPKSSRPPAPPAMQAPDLEQMEGAKTALLTFCMYYYQALREAGHEVDESKQIVADEISSLYDRYAQSARLTFKPERMRNPKALLDEITEDVKSLGLQGKAIHQKLLDFKRLIQD